MAVKHITLVIGSFLPTVLECVGVVQGEVWDVLVCVHLYTSNVNRMRRMLNLRVKFLTVTAHVHIFNVLKEKRKVNISPIVL
jgi:hypothetical protein